MLVCADGAQSRLATKLGLVTRPPDSTCSRSYVEGGTHKFKADGVVFYNKTLLPGRANVLYAVHLPTYVIHVSKAWSALFLVGFSFIFCKSHNLVFFAQIRNPVLKKSGRKSILCHFIQTID